MGSLHAGRRMRATAIAVLALAIVPVALAVEKQPRRLNAADQAAAKAATLKLSDFVAGTGWKGGAVKPDLTSDSKCVSKVSDLVITGDAKSDFNAAAAAMRITSETEVLESAAMVTADWQRTVGNAAFMACTRKEYSQLEAGFKVISFTACSPTSTRRRASCACWWTSSCSDRAATRPRSCSRHLTSPTRPSTLRNVAWRKRSSAGCAPSSRQVTSTSLPNLPPAAKTL